MEPTSRSSLVPEATVRRLAIEAPLDEQERRQLSRKLLLLMTGVLLLSLAHLRQAFLPGESPFINESLKALAALMLAWPVVRKAIASLLDPLERLASEQLVALAVVAAIAAGEFTTAALVLLLLEIAHFLEERSVLGARAAITGMKRLEARRANLVCDGVEREVDATTLTLGDRIAIRPGETIPADGTVERGQSLIDESSVTGESQPVETDKGRSVFAGTVNLTGFLQVRVERTGAQTAIGRISELLTEASQSKSPIIKILERYAASFVPLVLLIACVVLFLTHDLSRAITVLIVSCPGAFVLSGPVAMIAALAVASRQGILIKNTKFLESLAEVTTIVFDKTGTITSGSLALETIEPHGDVPTEVILQNALVAARGSSHPVSKAIVATCAERRVESDIEADRVEEIFGKGLRATIGSTTVLLGRREWMRDLGVSFDTEEQSEGLSTVWIAREGRLLGRLTFADRVRPEASIALTELRDLGVKRMMLATGDRLEVAHEVQRVLGLDAVAAEILPEEKLRVVREEKRQGDVVMVVGDGINDALALSAGDVGVALGTRASDIAIQSSDVALVSSDLKLLPTAIRLSRKTRAVINQNVLVSALTALVMILLAAGGFLSPLTGALLHNIGEIFVVINSARLLRTRTA
jgi:Cd2+/Zn2+-exporting ATPase/Cu+-exporting ATPase